MCAILAAVEGWPTGGRCLRDERNGGDSTMTNYELLMIVLTVIGLLIAAFKLNKR